jgi:hypothetical protein
VIPSEVGRLGRYYIVLENVGAAGTTGFANVKDDLPAGLSALRTDVEPEEGPAGEAECPVRTGSEVECNILPAASGEFQRVKIEYEVTGSLGPVGSPLRNVVNVSGGGAPSAGSEVTTRVGVLHELGPAGIAQFGFEATGPAGEPFTQADGHPTFVTTTLLLNNVRNENVTEEFKPVEPVKDIVFYLPLGMLGDPAVTEPCPASLVQVHEDSSGCPPSSRVGTILPMILNQLSLDTKDPSGGHGIYSMIPEKGYAAEFAWGSNGVTFFIDASVVRHDGVYALRMAVPGVPPLASLLGFVATFYGDIQEHLSTGGGFTIDRGAFLTNPSDCQEGPQAREASVAINTWVHPEVSTTQAEVSTTQAEVSTTQGVHPFFESVPVFSALEGCELLGFSSTLGVTPQTSQADEPSGYEVALGVPQAPNSGTGLATPPVRDVSVTLPSGTTISPSSANGLQACQETGANGIDIEGPESEATGEDGLQDPVAGHCPLSSQIASVKATTPLLAGEKQLEGHIFLATPKCGGQNQPECTPQDAEDGSLFGLYLELEDPQAGIILKLPGHASVSPSTGQITTSFDDDPQFPFSKLTVDTNTGPRAPLANSQACGTATTQGTVTSWSEPYTPTVEPSSTFNIEGCSGGFAPSFSAGSASTQAGAHSPFTLTLKREDREQNIATISTTLPEGLLASVANVAQCPEPQASAGGCPTSSEVGTTTVGVGSGTDSYYVTGHVYFTGPYNGAPFGLSVVVPAVAGPFNLGNVIVRVALSINQTTAQVTATSSAFPQIIDGVPLRIRTVNVTLNNQAFTFNPTSCAESSITGTIYSTQGAKAGMSTPFNAVGCKNLPFKPGFSASTVGKASKASGASLLVKVTSKGGPQAGGEEANIASVKVDLPKQLPSRLTTLQKACTETQFEANPAGCPAASAVGIATAVTPILAHPLMGPAYLVSHGGKAFPDLEIILQGEGVKLVLDGNTDIKNGITSSTFKTVPDAPISSFELKLPTGKFSVLGANVPAKANYSLCGQTLSMPTAITGQNGAVVKQTTKIAVTGCGKAKAKTLTRAQKLKAALKACKKKPKGKRGSCEKQARKRFAPVKKSTRRK